MGLFSLFKPKNTLITESVRHIRQELLITQHALDEIPAQLGLTRQNYRGRFIRRFVELRNQHKTLLLTCHHLETGRDAQKMDKDTQYIKREIQQFSYLLTNHIAEFREERYSQQKPVWA
jgi:hypothetical protein